MGENRLILDIVTPEKLVVSEEADIVVATGVEGEFGVLPGHIPFLTALAIGPLRYTRDGKDYFVAVSGGFAEVSNNKVTILAETAERRRDIDLERAMRAKERALERLAQLRREDELEYAQAEAALKRAILRIKLAETR